MKLAGFLLISLIAVAGTVRATEESTTYRATVQRSIDERVRAASASIDNALNSKPRLGQTTLSVLISFSRPMSIDEAIAFATKRGAVIEGFAHQVGDNFGGYMIPSAMTLDEAKISYYSEYESFLLGLSEQMEVWSKQVPDEATRASVIAQKQRLDQRRGADGRWAASVTGLYVNIGFKDLTTLRNERSTDIVAIELRDANRLVLPVPIVSEFTN